MGKVSRAKFYDEVKKWSQKSKELGDFVSKKGNSKDTIIYQKSGEEAILSEVRFGVD